jgi:hypothetical protein
MKMHVFEACAQMHMAEFAGFLYTELSEAFGTESVLRHCKPIFGVFMLILRRFCAHMPMAF